MSQTSPHVFWSRLGGRRGVSYTPNPWTCMPFPPAKPTVSEPPLQPEGPSPLPSLCPSTTPLPFALCPLLCRPLFFPPLPNFLLGALAGLPLTKESLNLRHPLCLALSRKKEESREDPRPPEGRCPSEGAGGDAGRGEVGRGCFTGLWGADWQSAQEQNPHPGNLGTEQVGL